jgi:hypothetical protein
MGPHSSTTSSAADVDNAALRNYYGSVDGKAAYTRETSVDSWQVKVHDPTNHRAGHDGWLLLGSQFATLKDAITATRLVLQK